MKLKCDEPLSNFAFNVNVRRYSMGAGFIVLVALSYMCSDHLRTERRRAAAGTEADRRMRDVNVRVRTAATASGKILDVMHVG